MISDIEHFVMFLLAISMSTLENYLSGSFSICKLAYLWGFLVFSCRSSSYILLSHYDIYSLQICYISTVFIVSFDEESIWIKNQEPEI